MKIFKKFSFWLPMVYLLMTIVIPSLLSHLGIPSEGGIILFFLIPLMFVLPLAYSVSDIFKLYLLPKPFNYIITQLIVVILLFLVGLLIDRIRINHKLRNLVKNNHE